MSIHNEGDMSLLEVSKRVAAHVRDMQRKRNETKEAVQKRKTQQLARRLKFKETDKTILGAESPDQFVKDLTKEVIGEIFSNPERCAWTTTVISITGKSFLLAIIEYFYAQTHVRLSEEQALNFAGYNFMPTDGLLITPEFKRAVQTLTGKSRGQRYRVRIEPELNNLANKIAFENAVPLGLLLEYCLHAAAYYLIPGFTISHPDDTYSEQIVGTNWRVAHAITLEPLEMDDMFMAEMYGKWDSKLFKGVNAYAIALERWRAKEYADDKGTD